MGEQHSIEKIFIMAKKECCTKNKKTLIIRFTIVVVILLICLGIAMYNIDWNPSQENETLESFIKKKNDEMKKNRKIIDELNKTIKDQNNIIKQLRDQI